MLPSSPRAVLGRTVPAGGLRPALASLEGLLCGAGQEQPDGSEEEQVHGPGQHHPRCSGQEHPSRAQSMAAGAYGQGEWPGSPGAVSGRTVPAGGLCPTLALPEGLLETLLPAPPHPLLQAPVLAALVPEDQRAPLLLSGRVAWGRELPGVPHSHVKC